MAKALGTEGAIIYAQGYSAISSVIPAFSKKGDIIVAYEITIIKFIYYIFRDECVNFAIQRGLTLSKSRVYFYKHNDLKDLELILIKINEEHKKVICFHIFAFNFLEKNTFNKKIHYFRRSFHEHWNNCKFA